MEEAGPQEVVTFHDRVQDPEVRNEVAAELAIKAFYGPMNNGASLDSALRFALHIAAANRALIDEIAADPESDYSQTFPEADWHGVLDRVETKKSIIPQPGRVRKWIAKAALTEQVQVGKWNIALSSQARRRMNEKKAK